MADSGGEDDAPSICPSDFPRDEGVRLDGPIVNDVNGSVFAMRWVLPADGDHGREYVGTASVEDEGMADGALSGAGGSYPLVQPGVQPINPVKDFPGLI